MSSRPCVHGPACRAWWSLRPTSLLDAGTPLADALPTAIDCSNNLVYKERLGSAMEGVLAGQDGEVGGQTHAVGAVATVAGGQAVDEAADSALRAAVESQIEAESLPMFLSGRLYDDGVIDPRDTRTVLGMCLSAIANGPIEGTSKFGVFRM